MAAALRKRANGTYYLQSRPGHHRTKPLPSFRVAYGAIPLRFIVALRPVPYAVDTQRVGVFGKAVMLEAPLRAGDRVEIYRPITCDPLEVPRRPGFERDKDE